MFAVGRFKNLNGVLSFRVISQLNGVLVRRDFRSQEEASAEKAALELQAAKMGSD
jgi:hypothetical protein